MGRKDRARSGGSPKGLAKAFAFIVIISIWRCQDVVNEGEEKGRTLPCGSGVLSTK